MKQQPRCEHSKRDIDRRCKSLMDELSAPNARDCGADRPHDEKEQLQVSLDFAIHEGAQEDNKKNQRQTGSQHVSSLRQSVRTTIG
jgi:hypothetical protein